MAQECGFFNAEYHDGEYDRVYNAEQFAAYFASFIGNGIFGGQMSELVPLARTENNMSVDIDTGKAWINGWWYRNTEILNLPIALADGVLNRKDIIVLRWGNAERDMWLEVVQGTPSAEAEAPTIRRDADYYDLKLCEVDVPAGTTKITQALITDTRLDSNVCGFVFSLVDQIDTTELYLQFNAQFNAWFEALQEEFEGEVPAILMRKVNSLFDIISSKIETTSTSTHAYVEDDLFIFDNKLVKATTTINIDDTISMGDTSSDNCVQTSIIDEIPLGGGGNTTTVFYNTWADALNDIDNIPEGAIVMTNDGDGSVDARQVGYDDGTVGGSDVQTQIDMLTTLRLAGYQTGAGSTNVTIDTSKTKRLLCITKKSGVVVESKEIPVAVLNTNDVIPLGQTAPVIGSESLSGTQQDNLIDKELQFYISSETAYGNYATMSDGTNNLVAGKTIGLSADLSTAQAATVTYNGNNSFTITSTAGLSVYLYADMMVRGGATTAENVAFDAAGTNIQSNDVDGAIKEVYKMSGLPRLDFTNYLHVFSSSAPSGMPSGATYGLTFTATQDCYLLGALTSSGNAGQVVYINDVPVYESLLQNVYGQLKVTIPYTRLSSGDVVRLSSANGSVHIFKAKED